MCVRVFREAGDEGEAGDVQSRQRRTICSICLPCTACTVGRERVRKMVITPYHTLTSLIPTMRDVAQVFETTAYKTTAVHISLCPAVIDAAGYSGS